MTIEEEEKAMIEVTIEETLEEMTEAEKKYQQEEENTHHRSRSTLVSLVRKKKATHDQNILVTATLIKRRKNISKTMNCNKL